MPHTTAEFKMSTPSDSWSLTKERDMTGEHGGCCCNHDDPHDNHDQQDKVVQSPQILLVSEGAGCCGEAKDEETSRSNDHAERFTAVRSTS